MKLTIILILLLGAALTACGESNSTHTSATTDTSPIPSTLEPAYASEITETVLEGLSQGNLEKYTRYGNAEFKAAVTQEILNTTKVQINSQFGTYQSKEYLSTEEQDGYTIVHYRVKFSKGEIGVRMVFDGDHLVAGQWFE